MRHDDTLRMAVQLLSAHLTTTPVGTDDVPALLDQWHAHIMRVAAQPRPGWQDALPDLDVVDQAAAEAEPAPPAEPKVYPPPRHPLAALGVTTEDKILGTVHEDRVECLECGKPVKLLKSHLLTSHDRMTWDEYLQRHGLPLDYSGSPSAHRERQRADQKRIKGKPAPVADGEDDGQKKSRVVSPAFGRRGDAPAGAAEGDELGKTG